MTFSDLIVCFLACVACHYWGYCAGHGDGWRMGWRLGLRCGKEGLELKRDKEAE